MSARPGRVGDRGRDSGGGEGGGLGAGILGVGWGKEAGHLMLK